MLGKLWSIINKSIDRKQCSHKIPANFKIGDKILRTKKEIANAFNIYFKDIGDKMANSIPNPINISYREMDLDLTRNLDCHSYR